MSPNMLNFCCIQNFEVISTTVLICALLNAIKVLICFLFKNKLIQTVETLVLFVMGEQLMAGKFAVCICKMEDLKLNFDKKLSDRASILR